MYKFWSQIFTWSISVFEETDLYIIAEHTFAIPIELEFSSGSPWLVLSPLSQIP